MENKKEKTKTKTLEAWARKADEFFDNREVEQFLWYCEDERFISLSKMETEKTFGGLMTGFEYGLFFFEKTDNENIISFFDEGF